MALTPQRLEWAKRLAQLAAALLWLVIAALELAARLAYLH